MSAVLAAAAVVVLFPLLSHTQQIPIRFQPEQVHLSYGARPSHMTFTWLTFNLSEPSVVEYGVVRGTGQHGFNMSATGNTAVKFTDDGSEKRSMFIHRVTAENVIPGARYTYHVGSPGTGWSDAFSFRAMETRADWQPTFAVFGDMGNADAKTLPMLEEAVQTGAIDAVLHVGDFAYDMHDDNARVGDAFMRQIEPVAAYVPYMTCPGNHEAAYNFSNYKNRFTMPARNDGGSRGGGGGDDYSSMYWSLDIGRMHVVSINTELYFPELYGSAAQAQRQYAWLEQDLIRANKNRDACPWIVVMGHKPMYCSTDDRAELGASVLCNNVHENVVRVGLPQYGMPGLEDLFYKFGVDLMFYAHEHSYERLWPVYNMKVCKGTNGRNPYDNPPAPVHVVTGAGGNQEGQSQFDPIPFPLSSYRSDDFGFTRMRIMNATHLILEQVSVEQGGKVIDGMVLIRNKHGQGMYSCH